MRSLSKYFTRILISNLWLKIASLVLAILIWYSLTTQGLADRTFVNLPYELRNIPLNLEVMDRGIGSVSLTVRGPQNLINYIKADSLSIPIALPDNAQPGEIRIELKPNDVVLPFPNQLSILQLNPAEIVVQLEQILTKTVKIHPFLRGTPAIGYEVSSWDAYPEQAIVKGPSSIIDKLERIFTEAIDINGVNLTFNQRVNLASNDTKIQIIDPLQVTVKIEFDEKKIERSFPEFEFSILKPDSDPGINVVPKIVDVKFSGIYHIISKIQPQDFQIVADCRNLDSGSQNIPLTITISPNDLDNLTLDPPSVEVIIPEPSPSEKQPSKSTPKPRRTGE
jgi:YbbR domain-containing protein